MYYKRWWDCGNHYAVILQYFSGCNPLSLSAANTHVRWKLRRLEHVPYLREINRTGNLIASVCTAGFSDVLCALEPLVCTKAQQASIRFSDLPADMEFERRQEILTIRLKQILAYYIVRAVMEFPPSVGVTELLQLFLGDRDINIHDYIDIVRSMQGDLPGGALGYYIPGLSRASDWNTLCGIIRARVPEWPCGGECRDTAIDYDPREDGPICVLIDAENVQVDVIDQALENKLWRIDAMQQKVLLFDSERSKELQHQLVALRHPGLKVRVIDRVGNGKSQVDFYIRDEVNKAYYCDNCRYFVIMSSDADYSSLVAQFPDAKFTYMVQRSITSRAWRQRMVDEGIAHVYLDESMHAWNIRVFNTEVVFTQGQKLSRTEIENDDLWNEFVSKMPAYGIPVFDTARRRLLSQWEE